jgi:hypothetical protein
MLKDIEHTHKSKKIKIEGNFCIMPGDNEGNISFPYPDISEYLLYLTVKAAFSIPVYFLQIYNFNTKSVRR